METARQKAYQKLREAIRWSPNQPGLTEKQKAKGRRLMAEAVKLHNKLKGESDDYHNTEK